MRKNVITINFDEREFECHYSPEMGGSMCAVSIYEVVRPKWKIFRTTYRAYKTFWVMDYETIRRGIISMVRIWLEEEEFERKCAEAWRACL